MTLFTNPFFGNPCFTLVRTLCVLCVSCVGGVGEERGGEGGMI